MLPALVPVVAVPARNEAERLPKLLRALNDQLPWTNSKVPLAVVIVLNNTTDQSAEIVRQLIPALPFVDLHLIETHFTPETAHVGSARKLAMETAYALAGDNGAILTTDADAVPSPDWVKQNLLALGKGADIVGGRIIGDPDEEAMLGTGFQRRAARYARYAASCDELASIVDPIIHDQWPRHQDHTGGSLGVRATVYRAVGGMCALPFREDIGFVANVLRAGYRLVHPMAVSVTVSARTEGRAPGGMADCVRGWLEDERAGKPILVEAPEAVEARLLARHAIRSAANVCPAEIARLLEEQAAIDLDVVGTMPIDQAIQQLEARILSLKTSVRLSDDVTACQLAALTKYLAKFAPRHDDDGNFPVEAFAEFARLGLVAAPPVEKGKIGSLLRLLVAVGAGDLSAGRIFEGHVNAVWLIEKFGGERSREMARAILYDGGILGVWNTDAPDAPLHLVDGHLVGKKNFASGVDGLTHAIVTIADAGGRRMILAPLADLPVDRTWWNPVGMKSSGSHVVDFTGVAPNGPAMIGVANAYITQPWFSAGAVRFLAVQTGGMQAIFSIALDHLDKTGRADNPFQSQRLARMGAAVETALLWLDQCARLWTQAETEDNAQSHARLIANVNAARGVIEKLALQVLEDAEQAIGAAGMIAPHRFERVMRDLRTYLRQPNPDGAAVAFGAAISKGEWTPHTVSAQ